MNDNVENNLDQRIDDVKREYLEVTVNLPRKQKKKRRKELNEEYRFLIAIKEYGEGMFYF